MALPAALPSLLLFSTFLSTPTPRSFPPESTSGAPSSVIIGTPILAKMHTGSSVGATVLRISWTFLARRRTPIPKGINDLGTVVGTYQHTHGGRQHGFI